MTKKKKTEKYDAFKAVAKHWATQQIQKEPQIITTKNGFDVLHPNDNAARMILSNSKRKQNEGYILLKKIMEDGKKELSRRKAKRKEMWNKILTKIGIKKE